MSPKSQREPTRIKWGRTLLNYKSEKNRSKAGLNLQATRVLGRHHTQWVSLELSSFCAVDDHFTSFVAVLLLLTVVY